MGHCNQNYTLLMQCSEKEAEEKGRPAAVRAGHRFLQIQGDGAVGGGAEAEEGMAVCANYLSPPPLVNL